VRLVDMAFDPAANPVADPETIVAVVGEDAQA